MDWGDAMVNVLGMTEGRWAVELTDEADGFLHRHAEANGLSLSNALADLIEYGIIGMHDTMVTVASPDEHAIRDRNQSFSTYVRMPREGRFTNLPESVRTDISVSLSGVIAATIFEVLTRNGIGEHTDELDQND